MRHGVGFVVRLAGESCRGAALRFLASAQRRCPMTIAFPVSFGEARIEPVGDAANRAVAPRGAFVLRLLGLAQDSTDAGALRLIARYGAILNPFGSGIQEAYRRLASRSR